MLLRQQGFTLWEVLTVVIMVGVLAAIATPSWLRYLSTREVSAARDELRSGILLAQNAAITHKASWRFTLREVDERLEWAVHPDEIVWQDVKGWETLSSNVVLDLTDTTLARSGTARYVSFGYQGEVRHRLSTVTLDSKNGAARNQCVVISTLLGATRKGKEHPFPRGKRYCY